MRAGLIAVEREVSRAGQTHTQRFWVREGGFKDKLTREGAAAVEAEPETKPEAFDETVHKVFGREMAPNELRDLFRPPAGYAIKLDHVRTEFAEIKTGVAGWSESDMAGRMMQVRESFAREYPGEELPDEESIRAQALSDLGPPKAPHARVPAVTVSAVLTDPQGRQAGVITRQFMRDEEGVVSVHHVGMFLEAEHQGKGIGAEITRRSFQAYREMGIEKVTMEASAIGRYTWARFGFNWDRERADYVRSTFPQWLERAGMAPAEAKVVADRHADRAWEIASIKVGDQAVGKDYLLDEKGISYGATLNLRDGDPGFETAKGRLGL